MRFFLIMFLFCTFLLIPQSAEKDKKSSTSGDKSKESRVETIKPDVPSGEFVYNPMGRRDPFWNLLRRNSSRLKKRRKEGLQGLDIDQLEIEGIIKVKGKYIALLTGPDGKPYMVNEGDNVYDGTVLRIGSHMIEFKKILTVALGGTKERIIIKRLNPEEEGEKENEK